MAAIAAVRVSVELTGLGEVLDLAQKFNSSTTPTAANYQYRTQATTNTAEALALGDVSTVTGVWIKAVSKELAVDLDYVSAFDSDVSIPAGEANYFSKPAGTVYVKNETAGEVCVYEYLVIGTT